MTERFARIPSRAAGLRGLGARDFRILVALASHCDAAGQCFPSLTRIAAIAGVDRAKVPASIRKLRAAGLVRSTPRRDETGDFASTLYEVLFEDAGVVPMVGTPSASGGNGGVPTGGTTVVPLVVTGGGAPGGNLTNHSFNKPSNRRAMRTRADADQIAELFDRFWRNYPSRGADANPKKPAKAKFLAAVKGGVDPELIILAAENYAAAMHRAGTAGRFIKAAETWLNKASWEQYSAPIEPEPLPAAGMI